MAAVLAGAVPVAPGSPAPARCLPLAAPRSGEPFFGAVWAPVPGASTTARLSVDRRRVATARVRGGRARFALRGPPRRLGLVVVRAGGACRVARDVWLLPRSARVARRPRRRDRALDTRLGLLASRFRGWSAFWIHDLRTGRTAGWNADAPFPAASLVKLGVLVAALDRFGAEPADERIAKEVADLAVWSSNLASNRLIVRLGGSERAGARLVERTLHRMGATSSTFTGFYRLGTASISPLGDAPRPPPFVSYRRTTARDVGRVLFELHGAALGNRLSLRRTGLSRHEARVALGLLLSSDPRGDNLGLFRPALGPALPMAQKHGWTTSLRHSAAIVYTPRGPTITVLLTYRPALDRSSPVVLGLRFLRAAGLAGR